MDAEPLKLNDQLCFALYAATNAITRTYRAPLGELGLTYPQYLVMITLMEHESMSSGELARALKLDAGTLTPMLKRLAGSGMIHRQRRVDDERIIDNSLTDAGRALNNDMVAAQDLVRCRTGLSEDDLLALRAVLQQLATSVSRNDADDMANCELV